MNASTTSITGGTSSGSLNRTGGQPFTFSLETPSLSSGTLDKYLKSVLGETSTSAIPDLLKPPSSSGQLNADESPNTNGTASSADTAATVTAMPSSTSPTSNEKDIEDEEAAKEQAQVDADAEREAQRKNATSAPGGTANSTHLAAQAVQTQLATTGGSGDQVVPAPRGQNYIDITDYLNMPQAEAAKKLGIPPSTLSKRWKEAVRKRKWPYRMVCKIDKEIMTLLHNVPQGPNAPPLSEDIESALGLSLRKRQEELRPVVIRI